jgi:hypothetical protein
MWKNTYIVHECIPNWHACIATQNIHIWKSTDMHIAYRYISITAMAFEDERLLNIVSRKKKKGKKKKKKERERNPPSDGCTHPV